MDYNNLINKAKEKEKEFNVLGTKYFTKKSPDFKQWRTRMYGFPGLISLSNEYKFLPQFRPFNVNDNKIFAESQDFNKPKQILVYVHIPFCIKRCKFCLFYSLSSPKSSLVEQYVTAVKKNLDLLMEAIPNKVEVAAVHFGGGTPTYLNVDQINDLLGYINDKLQIKKDACYTVEASPETIIHKEGIKRMTALLDNDVDRLSIGIQSFNDYSLKICGRGHNVKEGISSIKLAREAGFKNINTDLLLGLPGETTQSMYNGLKQIEELKPESVSLYFLRLHIKNWQHHSYMLNMIKENPDLFPDNQALFTMMSMIFETLSKLNYNQNRPVSFTRKPKYFRYSSCGEFLPLGAFSFSYFNNYHFQNEIDINKYMDLVNKGQLPIARITEKLTKNMLMKMYITKRVQFLNEGGLKKEEFEKEFGVTVEKVLGKKYDELKKGDYIEEQDGAIKLSLKGCFCSDEVVKEMFGTQNLR